MSEPIFYDRPHSFFDIPPQRDGEHYWTVLCSFHIVEPKAEVHQLDMENIVSITDPICFYCEKIFTPQLALRRCREVKHG